MKLNKAQRIELQRKRMEEEEKAKKDAEKRKKQAMAASMNMMATLGKKINNEVKSNFDRSDNLLAKLHACQDEEEKMVLYCQYQ